MCGHPVDTTRVVQLVREDALPESKAALRQKGQLAGDDGAPVKCDGGCKVHWIGEQYKRILLLQPQPQPQPRPPPQPQLQPQPLVCRDERALALEIARPKAEARASVHTEDLKNYADTLERRLRECNLTDNTATKQLVRDVTLFEPVRELLASPALVELSRRLREATDEEAAQLVLAWRALGCCNGNLVDWNDVLTACTGCNTAPYLLGAGHGSAPRSSIW